MRNERQIGWGGVAGLLLFALVPLGCGSQNSTPGQGTATITGISGGSVTPAVATFDLLGGDFSQVVGTVVTVRFTATGGATPFQGGTSATAETPGTVLSATQIQATAPTAALCGGGPVAVTVEVVFPSGVVVSSAPGAVTFDPPALTALNGGAGPEDVPSTILLGHGAPETYTLTGDGFGPIGDTATVTFGDPAGAGTEFDGNPSVDVPGTITSGTTITGTLPTITSPRLTADALADVTVTLPGGGCATAAALANFVTPPTITAVTNNRAPFDQANPLLSKPQTFLACVPTDMDIDGTGFDPAVAHLIYDTAAGFGTPIGAGLLASPTTSATNIGGMSPTDATYATSVGATVRVVNPDQQFHLSAPLTWSVNDVLPNANATMQPGLNSEVLIVVNPTNPANAAIFVHADPLNATAFDEMTLTYTLDYGATWTVTTIDDAMDGFAAGALRFDPAAAYDRFGNLYVCYGVRTGSYPNFVSTVLVLQSADGGATFGNLRIMTQSSRPWLSEDRWTMATGLEPVTGGEAIYAAWTSFAASPAPIVVNGCVSTGLGNLGTPFTPPGAPVVVNDGAPPSLQWQNAYPEVGPSGELYMVFFDIPAGAGAAPGDIFFDVDPDGLWDATSAFGTDRLIATSNIGWKTYIPPQPQRGYGTNNQIVSVRAGPHTGRLVLCYTDEQPDDQTAQGSNNPTPNSNTLVVVRISDDQGVTWGPPIPVHTDTAEHQFMHWLTCDRATGELYVTWYDCRNDPANVLTQRMSASSVDGLTWRPELLLAQGQSSAQGNLGQDYLEYCGTAAHGGCVYACWTDFSNFTLDNPNGTSRSDTYASVYMQR